MDWFMANDNRDSVHIDKEGNGLRRLWTQQLTTFPYARLETAEAVTSLYKTPSKLINVIVLQFLKINFINNLM